MKAHNLYLVCTLLVVALSCTKEPALIAVSSVSIDKTAASIRVGENIMLTATVNPADATDKSIIWTTSDSSVATVDNGVVTANKIGNVTITANAGGKTSTCSISVVPIEVDSIALDKVEASLKPGESITITATVSPDEATDKTVTWTSSDASIATVDNGKVNALKVGTATITAKAGDKTAVCSITVIPIEVDSITLDRTELSMEVGESVKITATISPSDATDKSVTWMTSDVSIVNVIGSGIFIALKIGTVTLTAKVGEKVATCTVNVVPTPVSSISLSDTELTLLPKMQHKLVATVSPDNATDKNVIWTSDDPDIATVDSEGNVTAIAKGTATITAASEDRECATTCSVTVSTDATLFVYAEYLGGSRIVSINGLLQYGSILTFGVVNHSNVTIIVKRVQIRDGATGMPSSEFPLNKNIAAGQSYSWSFTVGRAGSVSPTALFVIEYEGKEFVVSARYKDSLFPWIAKEKPEQI